VFKNENHVIARSDSDVAIPGLQIRSAYGGLPRYYDGSSTGCHGERSRTMEGKPSHASFDPAQDDTLFVISTFKATPDFTTRNGAFYLTILFISRVLLAF
jgi:hypothetical protein